MGNLDTENLTRKMIFDEWQNRADTGFRPHLGASIIGRKCERQLYYTFRWAKSASFPGRILRLFETGQLAEQRFTDDLRSIGVDVRDVDENGGQWRFSACGGHFGGSSDGIASSGIPEAPKSPHILEYKTHGEKSFLALQKDGVEKSKPEHYAQMQMYMGLSGDRWGAKHRIERALYMSVNKNTDDLYCERIKFDKEFYKDVLEKATCIIFSDKAPPMMPQASPQWYECKWCDYYGLCHKKQFPEVNCRTCAFSSPRQDGRWYCTNQWHENDIDIVISTDHQKSGCGNHLYLPSLIDTWATAIDGTDESIIFEEKGTSGKKGFINGFGDGFASSQRLFEENDDE